MSWLDIFKAKPNVYTPPNFLGALIDTRPDEAKRNDIHVDEVIGKAAVVNWQPKVIFRSFPTLNQQRSSMCGAFSIRKYLGIYYKQKLNDWLDFSEEDVYQRRVNKPYEGMGIIDMFNIMKAGVTLKSLTNVTINSDYDADNAVIQPWKRQIGAQFFSLQGEPIWIPSGDIETIASVIQTTGKGVIAMMFFTAQEWAQYIPKVIDPMLTVNSSSALRHFIVFTDFGLFNGQKVLKVDDSAHFGGMSERLVTEDFLLKRNVVNIYGMNFKFEVSNLPVKPSFDGSIMSAQECLRAEGFFPTNVAFVNSWGPISRAAALKFQQKYGLPQTQLLDAATKQKLFQLYP